MKRIWVKFIVLLPIALFATQAGAQDICAQLVQSLQTLRSTGGAGSQWEALTIRQLNDNGCVVGASPQARPPTPNAPPSAVPQGGLFGLTQPGPSGRNYLDNVVCAELRPLLNSGGEWGAYAIRQWHENGCDR
jgi:hypothetical protein